MKYLLKFILPILIISLFGLVYYNYFIYYKIPEHRSHRYELGDFKKFSIGNEINKKINVAIVESKMIRKEENGKIISFVAKDRNNNEVIINLHNPAPGNILNAKVIELLGHLHKNGFSAARVTIIK